LSSSEQADIDANRVPAEPTKTWLFDELSAIIISITEANIVRHIPTGKILMLHPTQYVGNIEYVEVATGVMEQEEAIELVWLNSQDKVTTVGCKISFNDCPTSKALSILEPLPTDLQPIPSCC